jgi:hypothetical protein
VYGTGARSLSNTFDSLVDNQSHEGRETHMQGRTKTVMPVQNRKNSQQGVPEPPVSEAADSSEKCTYAGPSERSIQKKSDGPVAKDNQIDGRSTSTRFHNASVIRRRKIPDTRHFLQVAPKVTWFRGE